MSTAPTIILPPGIGPCIEHVGRRDEHGYGLVGGQKAHRLALEAKLGRPIAPRLFSCHTCDNPPCVNQDHLFEGTAAQNNRDRAAKGRSRGTFARGDAHPMAGRHGDDHWTTRVSASDVSQIRRLAATGLTFAAIGRRFGIHPSTASRIGRGLWRTEVAS